MDIGAVDLDEPLRPGGNYRLPDVGVRNPGDEAGRYVMSMVPIAGSESADIDATWFSFDPASFELEPADTRKVAIRLRVPVDAEPGRYEALLQAALAPTGEGALVGAAAATRLTFTVAASTATESWARQLTAILTETAPWSYLALALAVAVILVIGFRRRFSLRVERRR